MKIGVALSAEITCANYVDAIVDRATQAAEFGLRSVWLAQRFDYDSIALAGLVGRAVPTLQVGSSAVPIFGRHPLLVSSQAQTTQAATYGRYHLGLALSARQPVEQAFGLPYDRPIARLREFLLALRPLLSTGRGEFRGELITAVSTGHAAVAGAEPPVPVLVAAMGPQALRVTGELADGTLPYLAGPRALGQHIVPGIVRAAERAGRPAPRVVAIVPGVVTADAQAVRASAAEQMGFFQSMPSYRRVLELEGVSHPAEVLVLGDEERVAAEVQRYLDAGATEVVFTQTDLAGPADRLRTWRFLGELAS